jgi:hypothetical protein
VYFIDSENRNVRATQIVDEESENIRLRDVIDLRIEGTNFNKNDTFGVTKIETILYKYREKLCELVGEFFNTVLEVSKEVNDYGDSYSIKINGMVIDEIDHRLSNGYQAVIRLVLELLYFDNQVKLSTEDTGKYLVLIDEIDEFLSIDNQGTIFLFLINHFPEYRFIVSTHSIYLIAGTPDCKVIVLGNQNYELYDSSDFNTISMAQNIIERSNSINASKNSEEELRILLNHKVQKCFNEEEKMKFEKIEYNKLSPVNQLIYKTIEDWENE